MITTSVIQFYVALSAALMLSATAALYIANWITR